MTSAVGAPLSPNNEIIPLLTSCTYPCVTPCSPYCSVTCVGSISDGPRHLLGKLSRRIRGLGKSEKRSAAEDGTQLAKRTRTAAAGPVAEHEGRRVGNSVFFDAAEER